MSKITPFSFEAKIESFIRRYRLVNAGDEILVAVSGGPDSMCLLTVLSRLGYKVHVAHLNYLLRQEESIEDELFVKEWCGQHQIPCYIKRIDTEAMMISSGQNLQELARDLRYAWFDQLVQDHSISYVATGHHESDQAETLIFNLLRGTGLRGAQGIMASRPVKEYQLIRPLIETTREDIDAYLSSLAIPYRIDRTNLKSTYTRNRIRHEIIPALDSIKPGAVRHLSQFACKMQDIMPLFLTWVAQIKTDAAVNHKVWTEILIKPEWQSGVLYLLLEEYGFTSDQVLLITGHLRDHAKGKTFYATDHILITAENSVQVAHRKDITPVNEMITQLPYQYEFASKIFHFSKSDSPSSSSAGSVILDYAKVSRPLTIRTWQAGDKISPQGMGGKTKKIKDMLTDKKISGIEKTTALVLQSGDEIICLLSGLHASENHQTNTNTRQFLLIEVHPTQ